MNPKSVLVFIEQNDKEIANVSLELICEARRLANQLKTSVSAAVLGFGLKKKLDVLAHYGSDEIYYVEDKRLEHFTSVPYAKIIAELITKHQPQIVLFGATINGRDLAPRVSAALSCGLTADCTNLQIGDYNFQGKTKENILLQIRPAFGGNIIATIVSPDCSPSMASVREGVMKMSAPDQNRKAKIIEEKCELTASDFPTEVCEVARAAKSVDLKGSKIIVAAGMGVSSKESLDLVKKLATALGAEIGCTRPVVDAGLLPLECQIGQTGSTVRPNLYIACGISGQLQHWTGISESKRIIAINSDPNAPILKVAHYSIVGDLNDVIPKMLKKIMSYE
ncbi:MAG: electron transfer flavoprotein subunit alpha/FixB family protein [Gammaproteobacteria bacterium]